MCRCLTVHGQIMRQWAQTWQTALLTVIRNVVLFTPLWNHLTGSSIILSLFVTGFLSLFAILESFCESVAPSHVFVSLCGSLMDLQARKLRLWPTELFILCRSDRERGRLTCCWRTPRCRLSEVVLEQQLPGASALSSCPLPSLEHTHGGAQKKKYTYWLLPSKWLMWRKQIKTIRKPRADIN